MANINVWEVTLTKEEEKEEEIRHWERILDEGSKEDPKKDQEKERGE